ncbi:MAG: hypothetical protein M3404_05095 [Actinomycetota bacterium]|nr:hypothetical protein [Actinomycetota bacterium]
MNDVLRGLLLVTVAWAWFYALRLGVHFARLALRKARVPGRIVKHVLLMVTGLTINVTIVAITEINRAGSNAPLAWREYAIGVSNLTIVFALGALIRGGTLGHRRPTERAEPDA